MVLTLLIFISFLLLVFSAICKQTPYEKHLSDIQQEQFIKEYQSNKKSSSYHGDFHSGTA